MNTLCFLTNMTSEEIASWVQAVGSIIAIAAGFAVAYWQQQKSDSARAQHDLRVSTGLLSYCQLLHRASVRSIAATADTSLKTLGAETLSLQVLEAWAATLDPVNLSVGTAEQLFELRATAARMISATGDILPHHPEHLRRHRDRHASFQGDIKLAEGIIREVLQRDHPKQTWPSPLSA